MKPQKHPATFYFPLFFSPPAARSPPAFTYFSARLPPLSKTNRRSPSASVPTKVPPPISARRLWTFRHSPWHWLLCSWAGRNWLCDSTGYGYPAKYFLSAKMQGRDYFLTNEKFGLRFFPPALLHPTAVVGRGQARQLLPDFFFVQNRPFQVIPSPRWAWDANLKSSLRERFPGLHPE